MAETMAADLKPFPSKYQSSRGLFDVLVGDDAALLLIEASSTGDRATLQKMLSEPSWIKIALESQHCIYYEDVPRDHENHVRGVLASEFSNLERAVLRAVQAGHLATITTLLGFASRHGVTAIGRFTITAAVESGQAAVLEALAAADPTVPTFNLGHNRQPLDLALRIHQLEVVEVLLRLGAGKRPSETGPTSYRRSSLVGAIRDPTMTALLLQYGVTIAGTGALHFAAGQGALESMRLLIQHGADLNELCPESALTHRDKPLRASWTPMHFAARRSQTDAMELLKNEGAAVDVKDMNAKTPWQILEERRREE